MTTLFKNNATSTLSSGLTSTATSMNLVAGDNFPVVVAPDVVYLTIENATNYEIVKVTARALGSNTPTIERAQEATTARAWVTGDVVSLRWTAASAQSALSAPGVALAAHEAALNPHPGYTATADLASTASGKGAAMVGFIRAGTSAVPRTLESKARDTVSVFDNMTTAEIADVRAMTFLLDVSAAIQLAIDYINSLPGGGKVIFPGGGYKTTVPIKSYTSVALVGDGVRATIIEKTGVTAGTGTATAPGRAITDSFVSDDVLQIYHNAASFAYYVKVTGMTLRKKIGETIAARGIFAPRMSQCMFEDVHIQNATRGLVTYDAWMCSYKRVTYQAVARGMSYEDDGSGLGAGTSAQIDNCWVSFDNTVVASEYGYYLFGLTYSSMNSVGVDNGVRADGGTTIGYLFNTCRGITVDGMGMENGKGTVIYATSSAVVVTGLRSIGMTGVAAGTVGTVFVDSGSELTLIGHEFAATTTPGVLYDWVIQNGATVVEINPAASPSGGNTFVSYSGGASKTRVVSGGMTVANASGTHAVPLTLSGSATFGPVSLADGEGVTTTVTVTGAVLGDYAIASFSVDTAGMTVTAWVSATNQISVRFQNESGGVVALPSGTVRARALKL